MGLHEQYRRRGREWDAGYAMAGMLVAIAVMGIVMSMVMPAWRTWVQREKEAELIFRGEQYMRAIELYQRQFVGAYPTDMEMLVEQRFLRRTYVDPMTGGDFEILTQGAVSAAPGQALSVGGEAGVIQQPQQAMTLSRVDQASGAASSPTPFSEAAAGINEGAGGIIGVVSRSTGTAMARYNDSDRYDEWLFVFLPQAAQPGVGTGLPGQVNGVGGGIEQGADGLFSPTGRAGDGARGRGGRGGQGPGGSRGSGTSGQRPGGAGITPGAQPRR